MGPTSSSGQRPRQQATLKQVPSVDPFGEEGRKGSSGSRGREVAVEPLQDDGQEVKSGRSE